MTIASVGTMGSVQNKGSNQASTALTTATNAAAQNSLVVVVIAVDNYGTTDGDLSEVTGVVSSDGVNKWTKAVEFTNGQGTAQTGATLSIWWSFIKKAMPTSSTITASFTQQNSRDAVAMTAWNFSVAAKYHPIITGTPAGLANDAADPGSLNVTTGNISCLRVRGIATEQSTATALTQTASWTLFTQNGTTGSTGTGNMWVRGEFIINTSTGAASDPTLFSADHASAYACWTEAADFSLIWDPNKDFMNNFMTR